MIENSSSVENIDKVAILSSIKLLVIFYISIFDFTRVFMSGLITVWSTVHSHSSFRGIFFYCLILILSLFV
jgi:hypothetical protein